MITERALSLELGIEQRHIANLRKEMTTGHGKDGLMIVYNDEGVEYIKTQLLNAGFTIQHNEPKEKQMVVTKRWGNSQLIECVDGDNRRNVKVPRNENFMPGMTIRAKLNLNGQWELDGRCPRRRGHW